MAEAPARSRPNNLPAELTSFVGRRKELSDVKRLLAQTRLLTLTGTGGAGKTRLALRAAAEMARTFPDGVWLVSLASIDNPELVVQAVFRALDLQDMSAGWSLSTLSSYLADKHLLLILDNCEHLLDSCALLAVTLLKSCPDLRVLATSRQALGTTAETRLRVPPLSLPEDDTPLAPEQLGTYEAVALLRERAAAVLPGFEVGRANSAAVLRLCRRLDGMPLALELAAVRLEGLTVEQVLHGLESELPVLAIGNRGVEARQQTLEATIGWSYGLMDERERRLWARLSVFAGGFDEAAAVEVCSDGELLPDHIAEVLASLVEKSIVQRSFALQQPRYAMLETVRHYGRTRLRELGEEVESRIRHCDWILRLARLVGAHDHRQADVFRRLPLELDNVWSALDFCRRQPGQSAVGAEICYQLIDYRLSCGPVREARRMTESLAAMSEQRSAPRARCLHVGALLAVIQNDVPVAETMAEESLRIGQELGDANVICWASGSLLYAALVKGEPERSLPLAEGMLEHGRATGNWYIQAIAQNYICTIKLGQGAFDEAVRAGEAALDTCRQAGELWVRGLVLNHLAEAQRHLGQLEHAEALAREGLGCKHALDDRRGQATLAETLAWLASDRGDGTRAAVLLGSARKLRESIALPLHQHHLARHEACERSARSRVGDAAFTRAFERGLAMSGDDV